MKILIMALIAYIDQVTNVLLSSQGVGLGEIQGTILAERSEFLRKQLDRLLPIFRQDGFTEQQAAQIKKIVREVLAENAPDHR